LEYTKSTSLKCEILQVAILAHEETVTRTCPEDMVHGYLPINTT